MCIDFLYIFLAYTHGTYRYTNQTSKAPSQAIHIERRQGLSLLINPDGSKGWRFRFRFAGKARLMSFGSYDLVSLAEAREKRDTARKQVANGIDPVEERKAQRWHSSSQQKTHSRLYVVSGTQIKPIAGHLPTCEEIIKTFEQDVFPFIGKRPISEIKP